MQRPALLENYDRRTDHPTKQPANRRTARVIKFHVDSERKKIGLKKQLQLKEPVNLSIYQPKSYQDRKKKKRKDRREKKRTKTQRRNIRKTK